MSRLATALAMLVLAGACKVGPDYATPPTPLPDGAPMPDRWHAEATKGLDSGEARLQTWWNVFDDPTLESLITRAQLQNLDLKQAAARVQEARAFVGVARGDRMPAVNAFAEGNVGKASDAAVPQAPEGGFETAGLVSTGIDASWEIDVFGRLARNIEAAEAGYEASVEDYRDVLVSLLAEVALAYVDVRALEERLAYARSNVTSQRDSLQLTRDRFNAGLTSALDVAQAESNLGDTEATIPQLEQSLGFAFNRLAVLLATTPGALDDELTVAGDIPEPPASVGTGIPADLVRQRPDVRAAERRLASQTARVGVATADLYPRFSLFGFFSFDAGNVGDSTGFGWSLIPGVRFNLFDRERIRSRVRVEEARTEQAFLGYEQTVLRALEDVENAMIAYAKERERRERLLEAVDATERSVELVRTQYLSGLTNFQNVLDSQRSLFRLQDQLATSEGLQIQNLIVLYRALGGGWDPSAPLLQSSTQ